MSELNEETPTEQPVEEKKKNKKPFIIGGILGGVAVIAIGAIILSTTGNGGIIPTPKPVEKKYTTAVINGKVYDNPKAVSIVDGVEVSDIAKLASLTDANKEAYICLPTGGSAASPDGLVAQDTSITPNAIPTLYWSNVVDVPVEYQQIDPNKTNTITLPKPVVFDLGDGWQTTYSAYSYKCSLVGGLNNPIEKILNDTAVGVWNPETEQMEKQPLPEKYNNWYSEAYLAQSSFGKGEGVGFTTTLPFSKWVQMKRMSPTSENQLMYVKGFSVANGVANGFAGNISAIDATPEKVEELLAAAVEIQKGVKPPFTTWDSLSPESQQAFQDGFRAFFAFANAPVDAVIPALPKPIVVAQEQGINGDANAPILVEDGAVAQ